jgi:hypothetical protein
MLTSFFDRTAAVGVGGFTLGTIIAKFSDDLSAIVLLLTATHISIKIWKELRSKKPLK